jgi:hypothetical protein
MKKNTTQIVNYFFLLIILFSGFWSIIFFKNFPNIQIFSTFLMCLGYVLWGMTHHYSLKTLKTKVVIEYIMFASIVFIILAIIISRS